jgi:ATP-dependent RNA helicase DeaD
MQYEAPLAAVPAALAGAIERKGFKELTAVQQAVLAPELDGRDLRISSQTGSGKTVAIGFAIADQLADPAPRTGSTASPVALVIAPTRELAAQIGSELRWLYRDLPIRMTVLTGGTQIGRDFKMLARGPELLIATPGRLLDHVRRGSVRLDQVRVVVLDEADQMLDMGFRDELEGILDETPDERRTHLVSATLPRDVLALANRYQRDAAPVHGTRPGAANRDIDHVGHLVRANDRTGALINLLLAEPEQRTLVFARTRLATAELAQQLVVAGFSAAALSGDMGQRERTATLDAFRADAVRVLVATDVAARGLDISDVARVVHFDPPDNAEAFTHRSGRTGRAGNKGQSVMLVPPGARRRVEMQLRRAGVNLTWQPVASAADICRRADDRLVAELAADGDAPEPALRELAARLVEDADPVDVVAALLARSEHRGPCKPRAVHEVAADRHPARGKAQARPPRGRGNRSQPDGFTPFHVSWGGDQGANKSRLLAMVCRRGGVRGHSIGAIRIGRFHSVVEVCSSVADSFARAAGRLDRRNPQVKIRPWDPDRAPKRS